MRLTLLITCLAFFGNSFSQEKVSFSKKNFSIKKSSVVVPKDVKETYNAQIINKEIPTPGGNSVKSYVLQQKIKSRALFPVKKANTVNKNNKSSVSAPTIGQQFGLKKYISIINQWRDLYGGTPNDNSMAVSNDGIVLVGMNSFILAYDLVGDSNLQLSSTTTLALSSFVNSTDVFDPKIIYDKEADRFILVFLKNRTPADNTIVICFSTTNNPVDPWNVYELPGNPLNNNRWTDFPPIAMTETDLFITGNLIVPGVSWQVGFDGSIVWQVEKAKGYNGDPALNSVLFSDVKYGGKFVRNLHPIQGADGDADEMYVLSNRNFDLSNDSIFVGKITGKSTDTAQSLTMEVYKSDLNYGMPPNGRQFDTDTTDPTGGLQTNDARVLAGIKIGDNIQFVSNTVNPATGLAAIYHGTISDVSTAPTVKASIIADSIMDFGYPNIAWSGNEDCDIETIIAFDYSSLTDFPGVATVYYDNHGNYSDYKVVKAGEDYADGLTGSYERWGDYFGLQRNYADPGSVFSFGCYGKQRSFTGWCAELISPDTSVMRVEVSRQQQAASCTQVIELAVTGGFPPYSYLWSNNATNNTNSTSGICLGDSVEVEITDSRGCALNRVFYGETIALTGENKIYPNPFSTQFAVQFTLDADQEVTARIYDVTGRLVDDLIQRNAKKGLNEFVFSLLPLRVGHYILKIEAGGKEIVNEKIIKNE